MGYLSELPEEIMIDPVQHVLGLKNPADIPTCLTTTPDGVRGGNVWQDGSMYLKLPREKWPFTRKDLDLLQDKQLHAPTTVFSLAPIVGLSICYCKTVSVIALIIWYIFTQDWDSITKVLFFGIFTLRG